MKIIFSILPLLFGFSSCATAMHQGEKLINQVISEHERKEKKENQLILYGSGSSYPDKIHGFILHYISYQNLNIQKTRLLFVKSIQDLLSIINCNTELYPYLITYPFTIENLPEYSIKFSNPSGGFKNGDYIAYVSLINGTIHYRKFNHENQKLVDVYQEKFTDALRIIREEEK